MKRFGQDENGAYKVLANGRVLRLHQQIYNTMLTVSSSLSDPTWTDGW